MSTKFVGMQVDLYSPLDEGASRSTVVGQAIARGGEGEIFEDSSRPGHLLKLYFQPAPSQRNATDDARRTVLAEKQAKIAAMLANAPEPQAQVSRPTGAAAPIVQIAWPQEMVLSPGGGFLGFTMRRVDMASTTPLFNWRSARSRQQHGLDQRDEVRLYLLRNLASLVAYVNKVGHAVIDLKDVNVLAYRKGGHVALIDCDGFAIWDGHRRIPATAATPAMTAPEFQPGGDLVAGMSEEQDRFAVAVMIFEILSAGRHPAGGTPQRGVVVPDALATRIQQRMFHLGRDAPLALPKGTLAPFLPDATLALFERAFLGAAAERPTAAAWRDHLDTMIASLKAPTPELTLRRCATCGSIDYGKGCPKCQSQPLEPLQTTCHDHIADERSAAPPKDATAPNRADDMFQRGHAYMVGEGVAQDVKQAAVWYRKAAEQGHKYAQFNLAVMYEKGWGVAQEDKQAFVWYRKAAEQGCAPAQFNLALMYGNGRGVAQDDKQAVVWYRKGAEQGHESAQFNLAVMYENGCGVAQDDKQAVVWYRKGAEQGHALSQFELAVMYAKGRGVAKDNKQAVVWFRKAAEQGHVLAQFNLALMAQDDEQAVVWFRKAAEQGHALSQFELAVMYGNGYGVAQDDKQAVVWYRKAAEQGYAPAQFNLAVMYENGRGVAQDNKQAVVWYRKAAEQGHAQAQERSLALAQELKSGFRGVLNLFRIRRSGDDL